ncbi:MAG TPA: sigma-54 dependent transcriptional regulator [Candidatus Krumholzibacteria bacterium]|nr:sigma-54 dependent transcriptional regulator [Candidatus Krumholzibacteria bacterium]
MIDSLQVHVLVLSADATIRQSAGGPAFSAAGARVELVPTAAALMDAMTGATAALIIDEASEPAYLSLIRRARKTNPGVDAIVLGGPRSDAVKQEEKREGVDLYVERPFEPAALRATLEQRLALVALKARAGIIGRNSALEDLLASVLLVAPTEVPILIQGESGTGKDVIARAIHSHSSRHNGPFDAVNCGALAEGVLESELFGHEKGAFTGAVARRAGLFERANGGTVFLDEVGEMSPNMQVRLLRVLESGEVMRVGGVAGFRVNVRVIAATNRNLVEAVRDGAFRQDLYYRLKGVSLYLPPLRERRDDIPLLVQHFIMQSNRTHHKSVRGVEPDAMKRLVEHSWPGNIRELRNVIETLVVLSPVPRITRALVDAHLTPDDAGGPGLFPVPMMGRSRDDAEREMLYGAILALHRDVREILHLLRSEGSSALARDMAPFDSMREVRTDAGESSDRTLSLNQLERAAVREALNRSAGNRRRAADYLGISERTLYRKIKEYGLA